MSNDPYTNVSTLTHPQTVKAAKGQKKNAAGGFVFKVTPATQFNRFLTLGTEGGTFYVGQDELTADTTKRVRKYIESDGLAAVATIVEVSTSGRAPKPNPAIFALAMAAGVGDDETRKAALAAIPLVCRTGTHLFLFAKYVKQFRGWGRGLRDGVAAWYERKDADKLAYQMVKYQNREGYTHRDILRLAHPQATSAQHAGLYNWVNGRTVDDKTDLPGVIYAHTLAHQEGVKVSKVVKDNPALSWEMLPSEALNDPKVWKALLKNGIPMTALIRQLPRLTRLGLCEPLSATLPLIVAQLTSQEALTKARIHPVNVLVALRTYASGRSVQGTSTWTPVGQIVDALDKAFYASFGNVTPTGKRTLLALDVSGSMESPVSGLPLSCRELSAALALVTASVEPSYGIVGFTAGSGGYWNSSAVLTPLKITPRQRLDDAIRAVANLPFGGTDCSLPMVWALENRVEIDTFVVYTDNETYAGKAHPHEALAAYRKATGIDARLIVVALSATRFSIADPNDPGMLDISGADSSLPQIISDFSAGLI